MWSFNFVATLRENLCSERQRLVDLGAAALTQEQPSSSPVATVRERGGQRQPYPLLQTQKGLCGQCFTANAAAFAPVSCNYPSQPHGWSLWGTHSFIATFGISEPREGAGCLFRVLI